MLGPAVAGQQIGVAVGALIEIDLEWREVGRSLLEYCNGWEPARSRSALMTALMNLSRVIVGDCLLREDRFHSLLAARCAPISFGDPGR